MDPAMLYLSSSIRPGPVAAQPSTGLLECFWKAAQASRRWHTKIPYCDCGVLFLLAGTGEMGSFSMDMVRIGGW